MTSFPNDRAGKSILTSNNKAVNEPLVVHGFSIGCKAEFYMLSTFPMVWAVSFCAAVAAQLYSSGGIRYRLMEPAMRR